MANLLSDSSKYQQIPELADWIIADLAILVNSDYFPVPRSLVAPHKEGPADIHTSMHAYNRHLHYMYMYFYVFVYIHLRIHVQAEGSQ